MRAMSEHLTGVFTTRRYTNPRLPYLYLYLAFYMIYRQLPGFYTSTKRYCFTTKAQGCEQLTQGSYSAVPYRKSNNTQPPTLTNNINFEHWNEQNNIQGGHTPVRNKFALFANLSRTFQVTQITSMDPTDKYL